MRVRCVFGDITVVGSGWLHRLFMCALYGGIKFEMKENENRHLINEWKKNIIFIEIIYLIKIFTSCESISAHKRTNIYKVWRLIKRVIYFPRIFRICFRRVVNADNNWRNKIKTFKLETIIETVNGCPTDQMDDLVCTRNESPRKQYRVKAAYTPWYISIVFGSLLTHHTM